MELWPVVGCAWYLFQTASYFNGMFHSSNKIAKHAILFKNIPVISHSYYLFCLNTHIRVTPSHKMLFNVRYMPTLYFVWKHNFFPATHYSLPFYFLQLFSCWEAILLPLEGSDVWSSSVITSKAFSPFFFAPPSHLQITH